MNKFTSIIRVLMITSILSGGFVYEAIKAEEVPLTEEQTHYLDNMIGKIESHVVFATQWAQNFLDPKNNDSYSKCANAYKKEYAAFKDDVLNPLRSEKKIAGTGMYGQLIGELCNIMIKVDEPAMYIFNTLEKHRNNPSPTMLGMDLSKAEKYTEPAFLSPIQSQLKRLQTIFSKIYQSLAKKINIIIDSLEQRKIKKLNQFESWKVLKHRVSCK